MLRAILDTLTALVAGAGPKPKVRRARGWPALEKIAFRRDGNECQACGLKTRIFLRGHHVDPVHDAPELELVLGNIITLCQTPGGGCHLRLGHTDKSGRRGWIYWNPDVVKDAALEREKREREAR